MQISPLVLPSSDCAVIASRNIQRKDFLYTAVVVVYKDGTNHKAQAPMQYHKSYILASKPFLYNVRSSNPKT